MDENATALKRGQVLLVHSNHSSGTNRVRYQGPGVCRIPGTIKGCRAQILWCLTEHSRPTPVDPVPDEAGIYTSHWPTCPQRDLFRRKRKKEKA